jgi:hypothetical protein
VREYVRRDEHRERVDGVAVTQVGNEAVYEFVIAVAVGHDDVAAITDRMQRLVER